MKFRSFSANPGTMETTFLATVAASKAPYVLSLHESSAVGIGRRDVLQLTGEGWRTKSSTATTHCKYVSRANVTRVWQLFLL